MKGNTLSDSNSKLVLQKKKVFNGRSRNDLANFDRRESNQRLESKLVQCQNQLSLIQVQKLCSWNEFVVIPLSGVGI